MPDEIINPTPETGGDKSGETPKPEVVLGPDGKPFDPVRAMDLIKKLRDEVDELKKPKPAEKPVKPEKSADKHEDSELAKQITALTERLNKAEQDQKKAEMDTVRAKIAARYGIPEKLAARLQGETPEAIEADAKEIAKDLPRPAGQRGSLGNGADGQPRSLKDEIIARMSGQGINPFDPSLHKEKGGGFVGAFVPGQTDE
jgi:hypothetical protein